MSKSADGWGASMPRSPNMQQLMRVMESPDIVMVLAEEFSQLIWPDNFADCFLLQHSVYSRPRGVLVKTLNIRSDEVRLVSAARLHPSSEMSVQLTALDKAAYCLLANLSG
jgi:hypothetical protein